MGKTYIGRNSNGKFIKGHVPTDQMKEKDRLYHLGKVHTQKTKNKISKSKKGSKAWNKGIIDYKHQGPGHWNWSGGKIASKEGYVYVYKPNHPYKNKRNYVLEHRLVIEQKINRYLSPNEIVHHINKIKDDNRVENLELITNQSLHMKFHDKTRPRNKTGLYV